MLTIIFLIQTLLYMGIGVFVILFSLGLMHQHLKSKGEAFGDGISNKDLADFEIRQAAEQRLERIGRDN